jgi:hypothetical protein
MPLNPAEVFELHIRCVSAAGLKQVISGTLAPYVVVTGNLVGDKDGKITSSVGSGTEPQWDYKMMCQIHVGDQLTVVVMTKCFTGDVEVGRFLLHVDQFKDGLVHDQSFRLHGEDGVLCGEIRMRGQLMHGGERVITPQESALPASSKPPPPTQPAAGPPTVVNSA